MFAGISPCGDGLVPQAAIPLVPMAPLLISVQAMELAWVGLNYIGNRTHDHRRSRRKRRQYPPGVHAGFFTLSGAAWAPRRSRG